MGLFTTGLAVQPRRSLFSSSGPKDLDQFLELIAKKESEGMGGYAALGQIINNGGMYQGDRAYGKYQIMGKNIPQWTQQYLKKSYTKEQFLNSPQLQESLMRARALDLYNTWGNWQDVASVHFTGRPFAQAQAEGAKDQLGTTVGNYVNSTAPMGQSTPQIAAPGQNPIGAFAHEVLRAPFKVVGAGLASLEQLATGKPTTFQPQVPYLQGNEPIASLQTQSSETYGGMRASGYSPFSSALITGGAVFGGSLFDAAPFGPGRGKSLVELVVALKTADEALALATKLGLPDDLVRTFVATAPKLTDATAAERYLKSLDETLRTTTTRTTANGDRGGLFSENSAWPTTASKPSKAGNTSTGSAPTGKGGVSAQKAGTSGLFEDRRTILDSVSDYKRNAKIHTDYGDDKFTAAESFKRLDDALLSSNSFEAQQVAALSKQALKKANITHLYRAGESPNGVSWTTDRAYAEHLLKEFPDGKIHTIELTPDVFDRVAFYDDAFKHPTYGAEKEVLLRSSPSIPKEMGGTPKGDTPFEVAAKSAQHQELTTPTSLSKSQSLQPPVRPPSKFPSPKDTPKPPVAPMKGQKLSTIRKWFTSGRKILQKSGSSGTKMAATMDTQRTANDLLVGKYNVLIKKALQGLTKEERLNVTDVLEDGTAMNAKVAAAAEKLRAWLDEVAEQAETQGFEMRTSKGGTVPFRKRENYYPRQYDFDDLAKGKKRDEALEHLVKTGQARNMAEAEETLNNMLANAERRAGNLENPRMVDLPGYEKDPEKALMRYANSVATRFTEAEHFGKKDEIIADLIKNITNEGGDYREAQRIFDFTVDGVPKNRVVSAVTQFNVVTKLSLSFIVNATQFINTATKAGILNTVRGFWRGFTAEGKELAELINAYDDFVLIKETGVQPKRIVRGVMHFFKKVEHQNRRTAANTEHYWAPQLIKRLRKDPNSGYAIRQLDSIGINIEDALAGKLTDEQLLAGANKFVEKTQFKIDPLDVPPSWKGPLGRLLMQFKSFSFMQTKFVRDEILKEAAHGNLVPLVTFVLLAVPASYAVAMVRNALTGREQGNVDVREWDKWMKGFGTIPTDLIIQGKFLADTFASDFKTPIEKAGRVIGTFAGPTADEAVKLIGAGENIPRTQEKNQYLRKTGKEQDPYLLFKRQLVEKIPFAGQYLKNKFFDFPKSTKTAEEKAIDAPMYDLIDELYKEDYEDPSVKERVTEYMKTLESDDERKRQLFIMSENGIKTKGISSVKAILDLRPVYDEIQRLKKEDPDKALQMVNDFSDEDYDTYKKIRATERAKTTEQLRELLSSDPEAAVAFLRAQEPEEQERLLDVMTDDEYAIYEAGK